MKRIYVILLILALVAIVAIYSMYYYIVNNLDYKFTGFGLSSENIGQFTDKIEVTALLTNKSNLGFKITNFNMKLKNGQGIEVGRIETIRKIQVPARGSNEVLVEVQNIDELQLTKDLLSGGLTSYRIVISGLLLGFLPIRYSAKTI